MKETKRTQEHKSVRVKPPYSMSKRKVPSLLCDDLSHKFKYNKTP